MSFRAADRDSALVGITNGGTARSVNEDDGNLNFDKNKPFANVVKATADLELKWKNFGFFGRGTAFYDFEIMKHDNIGDTAIDRMGKNFQGLDGFISAAFEPGGKNLRLRAGRQVISWGESTFLPNGINVVNPVDLSKLRIPGSELKEAFLPTNALWANQEITKNLSLEGFYLLNHDKIRIDPRGTYFSNNDFASDDSTRVILSFGRRRDQNFPPSNPVPPVVPTLGTHRLRALRSVRSGRLGLGAARGGQAGRRQRAVRRRAAPAHPGAQQHRVRAVLHELPQPDPALLGRQGHGFARSSPAGRSSRPSAPRRPCGSLCHTGTATYFAEYPEDIKLYGISFNTAGPAGVALQGEYSYRSNQPVQYATPELLLAALGLPNLITGSTQIPGAPAGRDLRLPGAGRHLPPGLRAHQDEPVPDDRHEEHPGRRERRPARAAWASSATPGSTTCPRT